MANQNANGCIADETVVFDPKPLAAVACDVVHPPIVASFNDRIRPLLDCIDKLRHLNIMQEGIQLPTIVVVGDQSSGKSSVLESLAGISLPRGQGICTRVPLVMRLQHDPNITAPNLQLEYNKSLPVDEIGIADAIIHATDEIAGHGKGISNCPLTLVVKKKWFAVQGQPEDIYEQVYDVIMKYIVPEESIILNVLSATVDFPTCESIRMSQKVDKTGERTLAVVTKADKAPEGLLEKVTADEVNIGLGYVCVRNRIGNESYEEARSDEERLFSTHPLLSKIDKSMVSVPILAQKLVRIQASIISKCLPEIVRKINDRLAANLAELNRLPQHLTSVAEALTAFMCILSSSKDSLKKIILSGEFDEYPDEKEMHSAAMKGFLMEEVMVLQETKGIGLPNFLPREVFLNVLQRKVKEIASSPEDFVGKLWNYLERVVIKVLMYHCENYPQLQSSTRRAAQNLIAKKKNESVDWVREIIGMEKLTDCICNPDYLTTYSKSMAQQYTFMEIMNDHGKCSMINLEGVGVIDVGHLRKHLDVVQQAFDLKMRMMAYWKIVLMRLVDSMALHIMFSIRNMINKEMENEIVQDLMAPHGGGIERMLNESPLSVKLLKESKEVVANIMDRISLLDDHERN
ncbi:hypothetical protein R3W88_012522 [Solanum pinnatisectum]|uniref:Dynamin-related protein 4C-like n=1 Tax=Solanum pinnatisectum TaxID=50273 RepID=A0AAV9L9I6_9SOLN|nr:hypothetical protein R3W88_012522 [Solanum pinnatisectum]